MIAISGERPEKEINWARGAERRAVSSKGGAGGVVRRLVYISSVVHTGCSTMPMIDVYAPADLFPAGSDGRLGKELTMAVLRAEGVATPGPFHLNNTAAFIHRMDPHAVHTAATDSARTVRVQVITPPAALTREGQKQLVKE